MIVNNRTNCSAPRLGVLVIALALSGCAGTQVLEVEPGRFPVPLMQKAPVNLGVYLNEELTTYVHKETIEKKGDFEVAVGPAQSQLFSNLATGVFQGYELVDSPVAEHLDGVLQPVITELQFSLPSQTRSDYYEIWIRYQFRLFDSAGALIGEWNLPAYGKANKADHGSKAGLEEAALAACRDAMAFFSINFTREPVVSKWLAAGKPRVVLAAQSGASGTQNPTQNVPQQGLQNTAQVSSPTPAAGATGSAAASSGAPAAPAPPTSDPAGIDPAGIDTDPAPESEPDSAAASADQSVDQDVGLDTDQDDDQQKETQITNINSIGDAAGGSR
ncbi:MAG: hypothetical protein AAF993_20825 [Pseudomonadota bacterium]